MIEETLGKEGVVGWIHKEGKHLAPNFRVNILEPRFKPKKFNLRVKAVGQFTILYARKGKREKNHDEKKIQVR